MDEELEQRGVTPESFFDQATETREMVQTVQKTSNSNLSLLNELKERVRKIEVKLFDEEDKRQKEEMEAKVKEQNEKTQGGVVGDKGGVKEPEKKGLMGQVGSFLSNLVGGLVGGAVGFTLSGVGGMIGFGAGMLSKAKDLGKDLREKLFGKKEDKKKKGGKVKVNQLVGTVGGEEEGKEKEKKGKGMFGGMFSGIKNLISDFDGRPGSRKTKNTKGEVIEKEESFSMPKGKETSFADALSGNRNIIHQFLFEERIKSIPPGEGFNDFSGNPAYDSDVDTFLRGLKDSPQGYGIEINAGRVYLSKEKSKDGGYAFGRDTKYEGVKSDNEMYGDTFPKRSFTGSKKNTYARSMLEFNEGGVVQKFNQGGEVDTVPAMLTPGEFVVTKDAVKKVGVNTLKGLNASVGATNKPTPIITESFSDTGKGDVSDFYEEKSSDGTVLFRDEAKMTGSAIFESTYDRYESKEDGETFTETSKYSSKSLSIGVPDLIEHKDQLLGEIHKIKGFENVTIEDVIKGKGKIRGIDDDTMFNILANSDASYATAAKKSEAEKLDKKARGIKEGQGFSTFGEHAKTNFLLDDGDEVSQSLKGTVGYRSGQINPASISLSSTDLSSKSDLSYKVEGYNQGGLVGSSIAPIIESRTESGEMKLVKDLSQLVEGNSQNINVIQAQNTAMNPPNKNPQTTVPAEPSNTTFTEVKNTDAPIPFAVLLRQNAQRYLNLGNNAMVIS